MNWRLIRVVDSLVGIPLVRLLAMLMRRSTSNTGSSPNRILLVKFWGIGNIFMLLPSIQALRSTFPHATIDFLTLESNREALGSLGVVNRITTIDTGSITSFLRSWKSATAILANTGYDLAIDFEQFARFSALTVLQSRAARTIGFMTKGQHRHRLYSDVVQYDNHVHISRSFYSLVTEAGVTAPFSSDLNLPSLADVKRRGDNMMKRLGIPAEMPVAAIHIGTSDNFRERRWAPECYADLAEALRDRYGFQIVLTGLPDESPLISATMQHLRSTVGIHDLGGKLSFTDYFALITAADLVISADTSAVHLASALHIPVVGLYGPNTPALYGPWGKNGTALYAAFPCSPCITNFNGKINTCRHPEGRGACMTALDVDTVFTEIEQAYLLPQSPHRLGKSPVKAA